MADNNIELKNIKSLSGMKFFIPDYQRGYRWTSTEVLKMLEDFYEFLQRNNRGNLEAGEFYCLQPVVVKPKEDIGKDWYEVIDGQQRLTTLYLILKVLSDSVSLKKFNFTLYHIAYQTRQKDIFADVLGDVGTEKFQALANVDSYYMDIVYHAIKRWFETERSYNGGLLEYDLLKMLLAEDIDKTKNIDIAHNVRVIWYEAEESDSENSIGIFTRLNVGKIALNNAELIKALFLKKNNLIEQGLSVEEQKARESELNLKQILIAEEWNQIEQRLQDNSFWYFLRRSQSTGEYDSRIEFIFDLMAGKDNVETPEYYYTFNYFNEKLTNDADAGKIEVEWNAVKKYFRELEYWYNDRRLFHLIGFLIEVGMNINEIMDMAYLQSQDKKSEFVLSDNGKRIRIDKDAFLTKIENEIEHYMADVDIDKLTYGNDKMRPTLLLFNIITVANCDRSDIKFPFDKYKIEKWDKEHIASQSDHEETPKNNRQRCQWVDDMLLYFCGVSADDANEELGNDITQFEIDTYIVKKANEWLASHTPDEIQEKSLDVTIITSLLINAKSILMLEEKERDSKALEDIMENLFRTVRKYFDSDKLSESMKNSIGNMALLNASINRSYKNALFPIKRMHIKRNDSMGVFVPIATKNVFLKYYSKSIDNMMYWTDDDAKDYIASIKSTLSKYFKFRKFNLPLTN